MLRRIRISTISILSLLITTPVFAHDSYDHLLGYMHEAYNAFESVSVMFVIAALFFIVTILTKWQKKDSNK
jgi:hypothetical protein